MPRQRGFTLRQLKYKQHRMIGMSQHDAAVAAGYSETTARVNAHEIEAIVKPSMIAELNRSGVTDKVIAGELASFVRFNPKTIHASDKLKAIEHVCKLKGHLKDAPLVDQSVQTHFTLIVEGGAAAHPERRSPIDAEAVTSVSLTDES